MSGPLPAPLAEPGRPVRAAAFACLLALSLAPVIFVEFPAMVDYPNHLARMSILARAGTDAAHPFYEVHWALYPNLAMDLLVPPMARWMGVELATKLFYVVSQLLIVTGAMSLSFVARGRAIAAGVTACLCLYAIPFAFGFVNFEFALGLALFAIAAWLALAGRSLSLRLTVHCAAVVILFFAHLFALGTYGFAIGLLELWRIHRERPAIVPTLVLIAGMTAPAAALAVIVTTIDESVGGSGTLWNAGYKIFWLGMLNGWSRQVAFVLALVVGIPLAIGLARGWFRFAGPGSWLAVGFVLLFIALPFRLFDTGFVDGRAIIAVLLILPAFTVARWPDAGSRQLVWAAAISACLVNVAYVGWVQWTYQSEYRQLMAALDLMPRGKRLIAADLLEQNDPPYVLLDYPMHHAATFAVYRRDAFVPTLFTYPGKQPLRPAATVQHLAIPEGAPIAWRLLQSYAAGAQPVQHLRYAGTWWLDFDYLLMLHAEGLDPSPDLLEKIASGQRFVLYRIRTRNQS